MYIERLGILILLRIRLWAFDRGFEFLVLLMARLSILSIDLLFVQIEENLDLFSFLTSLSKQFVLGHILAYFLDLVGIL